MHVVGQLWSDAQQSLHADPDQLLTCARSFQKASFLQHCSSSAWQLPCLTMLIDVRRNARMQMRAGSALWQMHKAHSRLQRSRSAQPPQSWRTCNSNCATADGSHTPYRKLPRKLLVPLRLKYSAWRPS